MNKQMLKRTMIFMLAFLMLAMTACDEEYNNVNPDPVNAESAILFGFRTQTPTQSIYYMNVYSEIPANPSVDDAIELGEGIRIWSFGEHPYIWNGNASTLTKWNVSKTDLSLSIGDVMSFASTGLSGDFGPPAFLSETQAYFFALGEGKIVEFSPSEMTITEIHDVAAYTAPENANWFGAWDNYVRGNKIIMPLGWYSGPDWKTPDAAQVAVFDITTNQVTYHQDNRLMASYEGAVISNNDDIYIRPPLDAMFAIHYGNISNPLSPTTVLKVQSDGLFDQSFAYDIRDALPGIKAVRNVPLVFDNFLVVNVEESTYEYPADPADRWGSSPSSKVFKINMDTDEAEEFTALDDYNLWGYHTTIDGTQYFWARNDPDGVQHSSLLRQNSIDDYTQVSKFVGGQIRHVVRLW